jgi:hypothetical protein
MTLTGSVFDARMIETPKFLENYPRDYFNNKATVLHSTATGGSIGKE